MKHIGWCLEHIQMAMMSIPREAQTEQEKSQANKVLDEVETYAKTLEELITNRKFRAILSRLENNPHTELRVQAHEIDTLVKDLEHMLQVLDLYIRNLREIIVSRPEEWHAKADQISLMIDQKFGGERGDLRKEFQLAAHTEQELRDIVSDERHLEKFLK